jgi:phospholipid/cholesterol/gamma-HCH transport system ATP-binding protein
MTNAARTATKPAPIIEVAQIQTRFGAAVVHEDVSMTIDQGEVFAIAGGNGSGKSVLMREMIMLQQPSAGEISIFGQNIRTMDQAAVSALRRAVSTWRVVQLAQRGRERRRAAA